MNRSTALLSDPRSRTHYQILPLSTPSSPRVTTQDDLLAVSPNRPTPKLSLQYGARVQGYSRTELMKHPRTVGSTWTQIHSPNCPVVEGGGTPLTCLAALGNSTICWCLSTNYKLPLASPWGPDGFNLRNTSWRHYPRRGYPSRLHYLVLSMEISVGHTLSPFRSHFYRTNSEPGPCTPPLL